MTRASDHPVPAHRYRDLTLVGQGVSAKVYRALDTHTGGLVAIKVLNPHLRTDPISLERFKREIQITRFLAHPQIVPIYDLVVGVDHTYMVMEYIAGRHLKDFIRLRHPVPVEVALDILRQTLAILAVCHAKNVIHRDLKPQNVIVDEHGMVRLLDFGISRMTTLGDLTQTGTSLGSPEYMAPELFATNAYDPRTDVYAVGVMLFELLTGELPFRGDSLPVLYRQHLTEPVPALAAYRPDLPAWLQHLTDRMLAKHAHERYQSVDEALGDVARRRVLARGMPRLEKRECLACGAATVAELPVCTACGHDAAATLGAGRHELWVVEKTKPEALAAYCQTVFKAPPPRRRAAPMLLVSGLDRRSAELLRQSALRHGVVLTVKESESFAPWKAIGSFLGFLYCAVSAGLLVARSTQPYDDSLVPQQEYLITVGQAALFVVLGWFFLGVLRRQTARAAFADRDPVRIHVDAEYGWLCEIAASARTAGSPAMQQSIAEMVEKYLLLRRSPVAMDDAVKETLHAVLRSAAAVAHLAAEVEQALASRDVVQQTATYEALTEQLAFEDDAGRRRELSARLEACVSRLEGVYGLQDAYARLANRLVHLHAVFNTLLGKVLVLRLPLEAAETALLDGCLATLRSELRVAGEVQAELRRVA